MSNNRILNNNSSKLIKLIMIKWILIEKEIKNNKIQILYRIIARCLRATMNACAMSYKVPHQIMFVHSYDLSSAHQISRLCDRIIYRDLTCNQQYKQFRAYNTPRQELAIPPINMNRVVINYEGRLERTGDKLTWTRPRCISVANDSLNCPG